MAQRLRRGTRRPLPSQTWSRLGFRCRFVWRRRIASGTGGRDRAAACMDQQDKRGDGSPSRTHTFIK
eukprot:353774-Chlamydomonas_euryale.AAC.5